MSAKDVPCPKCDAPAGSSCGYVFGKRRTPYCCGERMDAFEAAQADGIRKELERER